MDSFRTTENSTRFSQRVFLHISMLTCKFISKKIPLYEPWSTASPNELSNAFEGMEKLIMNRLYSRTFAPAALANIPTTESHIPGTANRVPEEAREKLGDLMDDIERDRVLAERIEIFDWVGPKELDIPEGMVEGGERFLGLAEQGMNTLET
jgi:Rab5 GDP/GTP exchange factor